MDQDPLGMEIGLGPGDFVLDGHPAPLSKRGGSPSLIFRPCPLWPNGWMDQNNGVEIGLGPDHIVLDGDPAPLPKKGAEPLPNRPISIVATRLDASRYQLVCR